MKLRSIVAIVLLASMTLVTGCMTHTHVVGNGGSGAAVEARQWYVLFGLVPLNTVDSKGMAGSATNYTIKTSTTPLDFVINIFTGIVTVYSRTVSVMK